HARTGHPRHGESQEDPGGGGLPHAGLGLRHALSHRRERAGRSQSRVGGVSRRPPAHHDHRGGLAARHPRELQDRDQRHRGGGAGGDAHRAAVREASSLSPKPTSEAHQIEFGGLDAMLPTPVHRPLSRRRLLQGGAALAALPILGPASRALAQAPVKTTKVLDFTTGADVAKAEQEGEVVYYGHDGEAAIAALLEAFRKDFPKIKTNYVRLQTGALYAKITAERSANRYLVDVLQLSDISPAIDFQKKGGYESYHSPEYASYKPAYLSTPAGSFAWVGVTFAGISYNRSKVKPEQAPKTWKDILNPAFKDGISAKLATSGMQHAQWYMLRKLYGNDFWQEFAKQRPRGFDARAQLFDRLAKGDDRVCA